jgi:hypothetical protein
MNLGMSKLWIAEAIALNSTLHGSSASDVEQTSRTDNSISARQQPTLQQSTHPHPGAYEQSQSVIATPHPQAKDRRAQVAPRTPHRRGCPVE